MLRSDLEQPDRRPNIKRRPLFSGYMATQSLHLAIMGTSALLTDHCAPNSVSFPSNMLSLEDLKLSGSGCKIISSDAFGVESDETADGIADPIFAFASERMRLFHDVVHIMIFQLAVCDLVVSILCKLARVRTKVRICLTSSKSCESPNS